ncbi:MAG: phage holin family protein [Opitutales bacterium]
MIGKLIFSRIAREVLSGIYAQERDRRRSEALGTFSRRNLPKLLLQIGLTTFGVWAATALFDGIDYGRSEWTLALVALVLTLLNGIVKPLLIFFAFPFVVFTLGLGIVAINAVLLWLTSVMIPAFEVDGVWTALGAALLISAISFMGNILVGTSSIRVQGSGKQRRGYSRIPYRSPSQRRHRASDEDVIDL